MRNIALRIQRNYTRGISGRAKRRHLGRYIGIGGYGGAFGGGLQQNVGGFATLNSFNSTGNTEVLRCCWNGSTLNTSLGMGTNAL